MKRLLFVLLVLFSLSASAQGEFMSGVYKGKPLYVRNPYLTDKSSFCVQSIYVNGQMISSALNLSAINIPFDGVQKFSPVSIRIVHDSTCTPKIVNPGAISYHSSFKFDSLTVNDSLLMWYTKGDAIGGVYEVEQLSGEYWDIVKSMAPKGRFHGARYAFFPEHQDGGNKYRVKYTLPDKRYRYSREVEYFFYPIQVTFSPKAVSEEIVLSRNASYQILNDNGDVILTGSGRVIPLRRLKKGDYGIVINEQESEGFVKK